MPNWCHNRLTITGDPAELEQLKSELHGPDGDGADFPISPDRLAELAKQEPIRWIAREVRERDGSLACEFWTAWDSAENLVRALACHHPSLDYHFVYVELGQGFAGAVSYRLDERRYAEESASRHPVGLRSIIERHWPEQLDWFEEFCRNGGPDCWAYDFLSQAFLKPLNEELGTDLDAARYTAVGDLTLPRFPQSEEGRA